MSIRGAKLIVAMTGALASLAILSSEARAAVLNFDDVAIADPLFEESISAYGGFTWSNTYVIDGAGYGAGTGYANSAVSGNNVALNGYGELSASTPGSTFAFNGAYFTGAFRDNMSLTVDGYLNGTLVSSASTTIGTGGPTWLAANFAAVDSLRFTTSAGDIVVNSPDFVSGTQFGMDDFTFNEPVGGATAVPELSAQGFAPALTVIALAFAMLLDRRRRALAA